MDEVKDAMDRDVVEGLPVQVKCCGNCKFGRKQNIGGMILCKPWGNVWLPTMGTDCWAFEAKE